MEEEVKYQFNCLRKYQSAEKIVANVILNPAGFIVSSASFESAKLDYWNECQRKFNNLNKYILFTVESKLYFIYRHALILIDINLDNNIFLSFRFRRVSLLKEWHVRAFPVITFWFAISNESVAYVIWIIYF